MANSKISNSLSYFLEQALILEKNSLETVSKVSDAVTSQKDTVTLTLTDPNDSSKSITYSIPSFGYLKSEIERLDNSIKSLSNIEPGNGSRIQLSDGSYRKIISSKIACEAPTITTTKNITNFNFKSNWLFEDMMDPYLYADLDLSNSVPVETERVLIQRYILNCTTTQQIAHFNYIKTQSSKINYKNFLSGLSSKGIKYILDEKYYDLPPIKRRYSGEFEIDTDGILENTLSPDGKNIIGRLILKSLLYTDNNSGVENTVTLKKNDILEVKENPTTTRYMVTYVDNSTNEIRLKRIEGYTPINSETVFKISSNQVKKISVEIPVSLNKREVIFIKAIDPDSNIPSNKWSPGIVFYSNDLKYKNPNGTLTSLETFYQKNVVDFGNIILSYSKDYYPSIIEGVKPDAPVLRYDSEDDSASDFRIVRINKQLEEGSDANEFRKLISKKEEILSQIKDNNRLIEEKIEHIQTSQFSNTQEKLNAQNQLSELIKQRESLTSLYSSVVYDINSQYATSYTDKPKYRVRGFWGIPKAKTGKSSGPQQIIQFKVRYRYLSESGTANQEEEFTYSDGNTTTTGRFSNWNEILTPMRRRIKGSDGTYIWENVNTSDPDAININQIDLPIQKGEQIQIKIKSICEAGFPSNPMESDWSEPIIIAFSDFPELNVDEVSDLIAQNRIDASVASIMESITENSNAHMSSSFYTNDKYFAHTAETITSGFLTTEQTPITLYDKLYDLQNQITALNEQIERMSATLEVKLIDGEDNTKSYTLTEGGTTYINAGNYVDDKAKLNADVRNGAIITKVYLIDISSDSQSGLELLSKIPGDVLTMCPNTISEAESLIANEDKDSIITRNDYSRYDNIIDPSSIASDYYKFKGRYDLVPINLSASDQFDYQMRSPNMYQSAQCKGQFIYSRFRNVSDTFDMYANTTNNLNGSANFNPDADFIKSENIYSFTHNDHNIQAEQNNFWIERYNFYKPYGYTNDINIINDYQKKELFYHIVGLYDHLTGSSLSSFLYFTEKDMLLSMWTIHRKTNSVAKNIILNTIPTGVNEIDKKISIVGIYERDENGDFYIYPDEKHNYTTFAGYNIPNKELSWNWEDEYSEGCDVFKLDPNFNSVKNNPGTLIMENSFSVIKKIEVVLNRLPKTFKKSQTALRALYSNSKVLMRLSNITNPSSNTSSNNPLIRKNVLQQSLTKANKLAARSSFDSKAVNTATLNQIEPKIQAAYGFSDLGLIKNLNIDKEFSMDDGSYLTTHKIGYEDIDRYRKGTSSCDSFLFLSPANHSEIQVNGNTHKACKEIKGSLRIPIIYQYRMEDFDGKIFGKDNLRSSDDIVKNTKYANIIGIDIWLNTLSDTPKQYDIVVYSTYNRDNSVTTKNIKI